MHFRQKQTTKLKKKIIVGRVCSRETTFTGGKMHLISEDDNLITCREPAQALCMLNPTKK